MFKPGDVLRFKKGEPPLGRNKDQWPRDDLYIFQSYSPDAPGNPVGMSNVLRIRDGAETGMYAHRLEKVDEET